MILSIDKYNLLVGFPISDFIDWSGQGCSNTFEVLLTKPKHVYLIESN